MAHSTLLKQGKKMATKAASNAVKDVMNDNTKKKRKGSKDAIGRKDDPIDGVVRVAASVVGFVSEVVHYRRERKGPEGEDQSPERRKPQVVATTTPEKINEAIWKRDDTEQKTDAQMANSKTLKEPGDLAEAFLRRHPYHPARSNRLSSIELPVVVPQRRPMKRARGFVRAYTPVLADANIDQETFLDFIDTFNKALEPNPYLYAMNLAGLAGMATPEPFMLLVGVAVAFATDATMEAQSRTKSGKFLDRINAEFFMPRGLICLVTTWKPDATGDDQLLTAVDFEGRSVTAPPPKSDLVQKVKDMRQKTSSDEIMRRLQKQVQGRMKPSSGAFHSAQPAPLVFPSPEETLAAMNTHTSGKRKNAIDRGEIWLDDYMDRRAQAKWKEENSTFNVAKSLPKPEFRSRYADPNHPAASGDIVAFVTGGTWSTKGKVTPLGDKQVLSDKENVEPTEKIGSDKKKDKEGKSSSNGWTSLFQKDVLYLVIVNLPSEQEIADVMRRM
ncbi:FAD binding domain protein [Colletotrichum truncatum]|uniref:FAD binding domain protein n=1 Tax=Colletotrichum truncatum TaxID=5467 RepID=A0ACC3ZFE6_COLTU|nr:FAD binding domain protein [Colletotrichum truncatum]KAF6801649.1 FAD binding domain protein [Colletotrichum truncatum]